jgi:hypothetical protein
MVFVGEKSQPGLLYFVLLVYYPDLKRDKGFSLYPPKKSGVKSFSSGVFPLLFFDKASSY